MKLHPWDPINYQQYNRMSAVNRKLHPTVHDCSHLTEDDEVYHLCETERADEEWIYEYIQCYACITRHFIKFHKRFMRDAIYADKIQSFHNSNYDNV